MTKSADEVLAEVYATMTFGKAASILYALPSSVVLEVIDRAAVAYNATHLSPEQEARKAAQRRAARLIKRRQVWNQNRV